MIRSFLVCIEEKNFRYGLDFLYKCYYLSLIPGGKLYLHDNACILNVIVVV